MRDPQEAERLEFEHPDAFHTRREFLQRTARATRGERRAARRACGPGVPL